ncbi:MAG: sugar ABC transporter substrate-binding protein [Propionibacteriaceae bacterium]|nr:sugar ABC transporter substrate-binding protein [Propionibacteriaceae bacterium]
MAKNRILGLAMTGLAVALALGGCSNPGQGAGAAPSGGGGTKNIALITGSYGTPAAKAAMDMLIKKGAAEGWTIKLQDTAFDYNKINSLMQDAAAQKVDAIIVGYTTPELITLGMQSATDAGVPVFGLDAGVQPVDQVTLNVTSDNPWFGKTSAQALITLMGGNGKGKRVLMLEHDPHPGVKLRTEAAREAFQAAGVDMVNQVQIKDPTSGRQEAMNDVADYVTAHPGGLDGIWAGWDDVAMGAALALKNANSDIPVTGVDGTDEGIAAIKSGTNSLKATVWQDWGTITDKLVAGMGDYFAGKKLPANLEKVEGKLITAENVSQFSK